MTAVPATIAMPVAALLDLAQATGRVEALGHVLQRGGGAALLDDLMAEVERLAVIITSAVAAEVYATPEEARRGR